MIILVIVPLVVAIGLLLFKKVDFKTIFNGIFWGVVSFWLATLIGIVPSLIGLSSPFSDEVSFSVFIFSMITAAIPEEVAKYISIKFGSKKDANSIIINAILVSLTFIALENYLYANMMGTTVLLLRFLQPGHLFFELIMALFLTKALNKTGIKKTLLNVLALVVPILCHTCFNAFNGINIMSYVLIGIGILSYICTIYLILRLSIKKEDIKIKWLPFKIVLTILSTLIILIGLLPNGINSLNERKIIKEDKIELKVISSEKVEVDNLFRGGKYIKVKVELKNNNDKEYMVDMFHFSIADNLTNDTKLSTLAEDDCLEEIEKGKTGTGYLYFEDKGYNYKYLEYKAGDLDNPSVYSFNLK